MTERGGPANQAGIRYQNSIAALYLGDLLRLQASSAREQVSEVRIEAPTFVDDIVVRYADLHRDWVQVKLHLRATGATWQKLWSDLQEQRTSFDFGSEDKLALVLGDQNDLALNLRECAERALSSLNQADWYNRLTGSQRTIVGSLSNLSPRLDPEQSFSIFKKMRVEIIRDRDLERDFAPERMPNTSATTHQLFSALRDLAGSEARIRGIFRAPRLRQQLQENYGIKITEPSDWGMPAYLLAVEETSRIKVPGTSFGGPANRVFVWPQVRRAEESSDFEDEQIFQLHETTSESASLAAYPSDHLNQCIIYAGPGFGKSALLQAISQKLANGVYVPAFVALSALADTGLDVVDYLSMRLNVEYKVSINWLRLCEQGLAVVLLDGLDEVPIEHRQSVIRRIELFAARFPISPWMLTVRDLAVIPAGFDAPKFELLPLSDTDIAAFVEMWGHIASESGWDFIRRIKAYPDLSRLIRIPLFLSILLATWHPSEPLPRGRSDLIEAYLKTLFRPEEHKITARSADPEQLRTIAEHLSFRLLEHGAIGAGERQVRRIIGQYATATISAERLYDDLIRCGILRRQSGLRIAFPFPIVQEYLAACHLVSAHSNEVASRAERAAERPWAQVIQFALEMLPDASNIARALLAKQDAFATTVRLVGRCILNGMSCDSDIRLEVGRQLAAAWPLVSSSSRGRIGQLLADGWSTPFLLPEVRQKLFDRWLMHEGAGTILSSLGDDDLTEAVLFEYLKELEHLSVLGPLQPAVSKLGNRALNLYAETARTRKLSENEIFSLASLMRHLEPKHLDPQLISELVNDEQMTPSVRIAATELLGTAPSQTIWSFMDAALLSDDYRLLWPAFSALRCAPDVEQRIVDYLQRNDISEATKADIIGHLRDSLPDKEARLRFSAAQAENGDLDLHYRHLLRVTAVSLGDEAAMYALVSELDTLPVEIVISTIQLFGLHRSRELGSNAVDKLRARHCLIAEVARLSSALFIGASFIPEPISFITLGLNPGPPHPAFDLFLALIDEWRGRHDLDVPDQLILETVASSIGITGATASLHALVTRVVRQFDIGDHENPLNDPIRSAVDELRAKRRFLDLPVAIQLAENSSSNARMGALYMISAHGSRTALDYMIERYFAGAPDRSLLLGQIEQLSSRLGLTIIRKGTTLHVEA